MEGVDLTSVRVRCCAAPLTCCAAATRTARARTRKAEVLGLIEMGMSNFVGQLSVFKL